MNNNSEFMPVECLNVPKVLFYDKQYEDLSMDAKLIYALLLDRKEMAIRNEWVDEYGDTYVIYPKQEIKKYLNIRSERSLICSRGAILMRMDRLMKTPSMMMPVKQQKSWQYFCEQFSIIRKKIQRN